MTNDSDNDGMVNHVTNDSPIVFGVLPSVIKSWQSKFNADMHNYKCSKYWNKEINLNILHISTDLNAASDTIKKITEFLRSRGFTYDHTLNTKKWIDVDVLIVGGDDQHWNDTADILSNLSSVLGIDVPSDVLMYYLDADKTVIGALPLENLFPFDELWDMECKCVVYSNIRMWIHGTITFGVITTKSVDIERSIEKVINWKPSKNDKFSDKIKCFKKDVKRKNRFDSNAELFFIAVNIVREARNTLVHPSNSVKYSKLFNYIDDFNGTARKCGRKDLCREFDDDDPRFSIDVTKHCIRLASYSNDWITEYSKRYC